MTAETPTSGDALERLFHEPNRLAIMSALCASSKGAMTFVELREACKLTDGNLSRHLTVLEENHAVQIRKRFVGRKPQTTVALSDLGLSRFTDYLDVLEGILRHAKSRLPDRSCSEEPYMNCGGAEPSHV